MGPGRAKNIAPSLSESISARRERPEGRARPAPRSERSG
jgi:hypothetical protein